MAMFDLIIIGGGAASEAAAMYAIGKQINFLMIYESLGGRAGKLALTDRDYLVGNILVHFDFPDASDDESVLIGSSVIHLFERQIKYQAENLIQDRATQITRSGEGFAVETERHGTQFGRTVIVATGATPRKLEVEGADDGLVIDMGYTLTTHAGAVSDKSVVVIGNTERAFYGAAEMADAARQIYLCIPGAFPGGTSITQAIRKRPNVVVHEGVEVQRLEGKPGDIKVTIKAAGDEMTLEVNAVFADMGLEPNTSLLGNLVELDGQGFIRIDKLNATSVPGIFAAGDITRLFGDQVLVAIGEGARAALGVHHYLLEHK